jgi:hypothetical protein
MSDIPNVLACLLPKADFAQQIARDERTVARFIERGMPCIRVGRSVYIDPTAAREWFAAGMPPRQPVSRRRRTA